MLRRSLSTAVNSLRFLAECQRASAATPAGAVGGHADVPTVVCQLPVWPLLSSFQSSADGDRDVNVALSLLR